jgi:hypothetical protein
MAIDAVECTGIDTAGKGEAGGMSFVVCVGGGGSMTAAVATAAVEAALVGSSGSGGHGCSGSRNDNGSSG